MIFKLNQPDEKDTQQDRWALMRLRGRPRLQLSHRFDHTDDLQALVLSVRIDPADWILKYGMSRWHLGSAWDDDYKAEQRLKVLAEAQLRKDLFLFYEEKKVPRSLARIIWIDSRGRAIP